jgi:hypothetical protein
MDDNYGFSEQAAADGQTPTAQFRIEVAEGHEGKNFDIRPLQNGRYEILTKEGSIGTIQLDESDHAHCESQGCELDMPLLHAIRDQIQFHEKWRAEQ